MKWRRTQPFSNSSTTRAGPRRGLSLRVLALVASYSMVASSSAAWGGWPSGQALGSGVVGATKLFMQEEQNHFVEPSGTPRWFGRRTGSAISWHARRFMRSIFRRCLTKDSTGCSWPWQCGPRGFAAVRPECPPSSFSGRRSTQKPPSGYRRTRMQEEIEYPIPCPAERGLRRRPERGYSSA